MRHAHADALRFVDFEDPGVLPVYIKRDPEAPRAMNRETFAQPGVGAR